MLIFVPRRHGCTFGVRFVRPDEPTKPEVFVIRANGLVEKYNPGLKGMLGKSGFSTGAGKLAPRALLPLPTSRLQHAEKPAASAEPILSTSQHRDTITYIDGTDPLVHAAAPQ